MDGDYRVWKQTDPYLNRREAWPVSEFPDAPLRWFSDAGCFVVALSIMLRHYAVVTDANPGNFNPWIFFEKMKAVNGFDEIGDLDPDKIAECYPVKYCGDIQYSRQAVAEAVREGYMCLLTVPGAKCDCHYIVLDEVTDMDVRIIDPASAKTKLCEYSKVFFIVRYQKNERLN